MKNISKGLYNIIDKDGINKSIRNVLKRKIDFNTYTTPKGLRELREEICNVLNEDNKYKINYKDMIITSGSQQSLNLVIYSLLNSGDTVLIEQPTYYGAIEVFEKRKINLVDINLNSKGLDLEELEEKIKIYKPKMIYCVPSFNNPTGYVWTNSFRKKFLRIINKYKILVLEDDPYSLINYTKKNYRSLYDLNEGKNVIYLGTFSKYISPSISVGYIITSQDRMQLIYEFKESFDLCTSLFIQYVVLYYLKNNDIKEIVKKKIDKYKSLKKEMISYILREYKDMIVSYTEPKGGLFFLVKFKDEVDEQIFDNGNRFYISGSHLNEARINICSLLN